MDKKKANCWEIKKCGRQLGGEHSFELGVCPAATEVMLDGVHGGNNAGRACDGNVQGTFEEKMKECSECPVYTLIRNEEGDTFETTVVLLEKATD
jgi:hypothetical protein